MVTTVEVTTQPVLMDVVCDVKEMVSLGSLVKSQYDEVEPEMVEKGPRPPQKHHEDGSLLNPINELLPSLQMGGRVDEAVLKVVGLEVGDLVGDERVVKPVDPGVLVAVVTVADCEGEADVVVDPESFPQGKVVG